MLTEFVKKYGYQLVKDEYELEAGKGYHLWFSDENNKLHIFKNNTLIAVFTDSEDRKEGLHVLGTINDLNELEKLYTNIYSLLNYIYNEYENKVMYEYGRMQVERRRNEIMGITCQYLINYIEEKGLPSDHNDYDLYYPLEEPYSLFYNVEQHELAFYKNGIQVKTVDIKFVLDRKTLNNNLTKFNTIYELIDYYDNIYQDKKEEENKKQEAVKDFLSK